MREKIGPLIILASIMLLPAVSYPAATGDPCEFKCNDEGGDGTWEHSFSSSVGALFDCSPNTCHLESLAGTCSQYHFTCEPEFATAEELEEGRHAIGQLRPEERRLVADILAKYSGSIALGNSQRGAVQVVACDRTVLAHVPLPSNPVNAGD